MARRRYRIKRRRGRWSSNISTVNSGVITAPANVTFFSNTTLAENPIQSNATVSQQYTVKNVELSYEIEINYNNNSSAVEALTAYIVYVPQGMTVTETYPNNHPEYIMAYRFLGSPNIETPDGANYVNPGRLPSKIKTRMARRLQTGDSISLLIVGINNGDTAQTLQFTGILRWWTKAN